MFQSSKLLRVVLIVLGVVAFALGLIAWSWYFTTSRLNASAQSIGVFSSPEEGMLTLVHSGWSGIQEARIVHAVPETALGGGPHVWYVIACVWAKSRADGSSVGSPTHDFDAPGNYFVDTHEGWVLIRGDFSPLIVGFWMKIFGLAGDDRPQVIFDPSTQSTPMCVRQAG